MAATTIHSYLEKMEPEERKETMDEIVHRDGTKMVIDGRKLAVLIDSAKAVAMVSIKAWKDGTGVYQRSLKFIRKELPALSGEAYVLNISENFAKFVEACAA